MIVWRRQCLDPVCIIIGSNGDGCNFFDHALFHKAETSSSYSVDAEWWVVLALFDA